MLRATQTFSATSCGRQQKRGRGGEVVWQAALHLPHWNIGGGCRRPICMPEWARAHVQLGGVGVGVVIIVAAVPLAVVVAVTLVVVGVGPGDVVGHLPSWAAAACRLLPLAAWAALLAMLLCKLISQMHAKFPQKGQTPRPAKTTALFPILVPHSTCHSHSRLPFQLPFVWHSITKWRFLVNVCHSSYPKHVTPTSFASICTSTAMSSAPQARSLLFLRDSTSQETTTTKRPTISQMNKQTRKQSDNWDWKCMTNSWYPSWKQLDSIMTKLFGVEASNILKVYALYRKFNISKVPMISS